MTPFNVGPRAAAALVGARRDGSARRGALTPPEAYLTCSRHNTFVTCSPVCPERYTESVRYLQPKKATSAAGPFLTEGQSSSKLRLNSAVAAGGRLPPRPPTPPLHGMHGMAWLASAAAAAAASAGRRSVWLVVPAHPPQRCLPLSTVPNLSVVVVAGAAH
ncbi:hypothetical protein ON010_g14631 [Phytophthora cinnamomi]|nr:hypothetical protein ON010_g14631 [Phytophthora cinnamomi]